MSRKEVDRYHVVRNVLGGKLSQVNAARILGLTERQLRRLCRRVEADGAKGLVHRLRGRPSNHQPDPEALELVLNALNLPDWDGFGPTFARDKLKSIFNLKVSKETIRQVMIQSELWLPKQRRARHRSWREPRPMLGMMIQLDGSVHDWFEGRAPRCVLLAYIDDATSRLMHAEFVDAEATLTLLRTTRDYLRRFGRPVEFYVDCHTVYKINRSATVEEELQQQGPVSQFTRAMKQLDIQVISALSPQAKGRVERCFGTHQDRLVKELRLRGISNRERANRFLLEQYIPEHNARFARPAAAPGDAHRPLLPSHDLRSILAVQAPRVVQNDYVVQFETKFLQLERSQPVRVKPKDEVIVERRLDGSLRIKLRGASLKFTQLDKRPYRPLADNLSLPPIDEIKPKRHRTDPFYHDMPIRGDLPANPPATQLYT